MLINHFIPLPIEALVGLQEVDHSWVSTSLTCEVDYRSSPLANLVHNATAFVYEDNEEKNLIQGNCKSPLCILVFYDYQHSEYAALMLTTDSEDLLAINNSGLAQAMLTDDIDRISVQTARLYHDTTCGELINSDKSCLEIGLFDFATRKLIHVFWRGKFVKESKLEGFCRA